MMHADQGLWPLGLMARGYDVGGGLGHSALTQAVREDRAQN